MNYLLLRKFATSLKADGLRKTAAKVVSYTFGDAGDADLKGIMLAQASPEERFNAIYSQNYWDTQESASGPGSTLRYTENLRRELPSLLAQHSIRRVFDAPCGDFHWMGELLTQVDVDYIGGDIVKPLVEANQAKYGRQRVRFIHVDLTKDPLPGADLMICRDCLFHLSFEDTAAVLLNFVQSNIPLLLTSTHSKLGAFRNSDIRTGDFRLIDLFAPPYNLPPDTISRIEDWLPPDPERLMCLWSREQISSALSRYGRED